MDPVTILMGLAQFAPSLIRWATGSDTVGKVAEVAVNVAKSVTGTSTADEAIEAMKADPSLAIQFKQQMMQQEMDFEKLYIDDKASARARDIALSSTPRGNVRANWLAGLAVAVIIFILIVLVFKSDELNEFAKGSLTTILGVFLQLLVNIYNFEFGTTRRSREKSDILREM